MTTKRVSAAVLGPLREALTHLYWFKPDLRNFLEDATGERGLVAQINWDGQTKRDSIRQFVAILNENQHRYFEPLLELILATADHGEPSHLRPLEDGALKYERARSSLASLRPLVEPYRRQRTDAEEAARRREVESRRNEKGRALSEELRRLSQVLTELHSADPQRRGYELERLLNELFNVFDIDCKNPFRNGGEQIDGAFTLDGTEYLLEAKWQSHSAATSDLAFFACKLANTLGLFVSMEGFGPSAAVLGHQGQRPRVLCMDGGDLAAILEERISLPLLLARKKQWAAQTGEVFKPAWLLLD